MSDRLQQLSDIGVSIWLDDLDRSRLTSGGLAAMIDQDHVVGVTTNPSIFSKAISTGAQAYATQVASLADGQADADFAVREMTTQDVRDACDVMSAVSARTNGVDGRVSIEVDHAWPGRPNPRSSRPEHCGRWSTAQSAGQDPGYRRGSASDHAASCPRASVSMSP
jgi:hypothetical protein